MRRFGYLVIWFWLLIIGLGGCGQQVAQEPALVQVSAGTVTISGKLYTGTITTSSVQQASGVRILATANSPIANYNVIAIGTVDKKIYFPTSKTATAEGDFSISVPSGESFYLEIINDKNKFVAPISFAATGDAVVMAITPEAGGGTINLGQIVFDGGKGAVVTSEVKTSLQDKDSTARKKIGLPVSVGAGNLGRGTGEAYVPGGQQSDKIDEDEDGLPDVVDIDDDGDGKVDGLDDTPRKPEMVEVKVTGVGNTNVFTNLSLRYEEYPTYISGSLNTALIDVATRTVVAIEIVPSSGYTPDSFSDVRIVEGPPWIETARIYGGTGSLWKESSYKLNKSSERNRWEIHVTPNGIPEAGDVLKFRVTFTATGTYEDFISTLTYIFTNIPRLVGYVDGVGIKEGASNLDLGTYEAYAGKFPYTGEAITFLWTAPKDDTGNYVTNVDWYLDQVNYFTGSSVVVAGAFKITSAVITTTHSTFETVYRYTFTPTDESFDYFKVDIKAQSPLLGGGNAFQTIQFSKTP